MIDPGNLHIELVIEVGRISIPVKTLMGFAPDKYIDLNKRADEPFDIVIDQKVIAKGTPGNLNGIKCITITEIIHPHEIKNREISDKSKKNESTLKIMMNANIDLSVIFGQTLMSIKDVMSFKKGSRVGVDNQTGEPVDIVVKQKVIAKGEVVVVGGMYQVRITEIVSPLE